MKRIVLFLLVVLLISVSAYASSQGFAIYVDLSYVNYYDLSLYDWVQSSYSRSLFCVLSYVDLYNISQMDEVFDELNIDAACFGMNTGHQGEPGKIMLVLPTFQRDKIAVITYFPKTDEATLELVVRTNGFFSVNQIGSMLQSYCPDGIWQLDSKMSDKAFDGLVGNIPDIDGSFYPQALKGKKMSASQWMSSAENRALFACYIYGDLCYNGYADSLDSAVNLNSVYVGDCGDDILIAVFPTKDLSASIMILYSPPNEYGEYSIVQNGTSGITVAKDIANMTNKYYKPRASEINEAIKIYNSRESNYGKIGN